MTIKLNLFFTILLLTLTLSHSRPTALTRPKSSLSSSTRSYSDQLKTNSKGNNDNKNDNGYGSEGYYFPPGTKPATGFTQPGEDWGGGSYSKGDVVRPTEVTLTLSHSRLTVPTQPKFLSSSSSTGSYSDQLKKNSKGKNNKKIDKGYGSGGNFGPGTEPGTGFGVPGFSGKDWGNMGGGYGGGYGVPRGGYSKGGVVRPTVVCKEKGRCYMKKLTCPAKCFKSFSRSGKGYGGGGGGGGCTIDCKKKCVAYC